MKSARPKKMCKFQGLPPYYLPKWRYMPLEKKLPMLKETPDGAVNLLFGDGNIGTGPWLKNKNLDFNTWDPLLLRLPSNPEYNALRDPNLKCYFNNARRLKHLYRQGLITREGKSCVTLKDYNKYRSYLHDCSLEAIRTMQNQTECEDVHNLVVRTVIRSKEEKRLRQGDPCDPTALGARYSEILRDEMKGVCERSVTEFESTPYFREFCEGERQSLLKLRQVLLDYIKKKALIRLRKLQNYEDTQAKFWNEWMKRTKAQVQDRADDIAKEKVLNYEKCKHIREFNEYISYKRREIIDVVQRSRDRHNMQLSNLINTTRKRICVKSHRQYPLSAQCPYNVFEGGEYGDPCPYNELVMHLEAELYCDYDDDYSEEHIPYPKEKSKLDDMKPSKEMEKQDSNQYVGERKCSEEHLETEMSRAAAAQEEVPSVADSLAFTIIQNAMALTVKHLRLPLACVPPVNQSKFKIIRIQYFMKEMSNEIKDELADLLKNDLEILHALSKAKKSAAEKEIQLKHQVEPDSDSKEPKSRWEGAPILRSNSPSLTGRYIREQLIKVSGRMKCEGFLMEDKNQAPQAVLDTRFQAAISEASKADDIATLSCQLIEGKKAVCEAREILDALEPKEEDKDGLVLCLIAALLRTALITIKDSLSCGAIESDDVLTISSFIYKEQDRKRQAALCKDVQELIEKYSDDLMKNKCMDYLIRDTIRKIKCSKDAPQSDEEIGKLLSKAAKKFVTKVIENLMTDEIFKRKKDKKAREKMKYMVECEDLSEEEMEKECDGSDSLADYNAEDKPATVDQVHGEDKESEYNMEDLPTTIDEVYEDEYPADYNIEDQPDCIDDVINDDMYSKYNEEDKPTTIDQVYPEDISSEYNAEDLPTHIDEVYDGCKNLDEILGYSAEDLPTHIDEVYDGCKNLDEILEYGGEDQPADADFTPDAKRKHISGDAEIEYRSGDVPADYEKHYLSTGDKEEEYRSGDVPADYEKHYLSTGDKEGEYRSGDVPADYEKHYLSTGDKEGEYRSGDVPADYEKHYLSTGDKEEEYRSGDVPADYEKHYLSTGDKEGEYRSGDVPADYEEHYLSTGDKEHEYRSADVPADYEELYLSTGDAEQEYRSADVPAEYEELYLSTGDAEQEYRSEDIPASFGGAKKMYELSLEGQKKMKSFSEKSRSSKGSKKVQITDQEKQDSVKLSDEAEEAVKYSEPLSALSPDSLFSEQRKEMAEFADQRVAVETEIVEKVKVETIAETDVVE